MNPFNFDTPQRFKSVSGLNCITVDNTAIPLSDKIKILDVTLTPILQWNFTLLSPTFIITAFLDKSIHPWMMLWLPVLHRHLPGSDEFYLMLLFWSIQPVFSESRVRWPELWWTSALVLHSFPLQSSSSFIGFHWSGALQLKLSRHCILVVICLLLHILYRFWDKSTYWLKIAIFPVPFLQDINALQLSDVSASQKRCKYFRTVFFLIDHPGLSGGININEKMNKQHCNAIQRSFYYQYDTSLGKYVCWKFTILLRDTSENGANLWFLNLILSANHWVHVRLCVYRTVKHISLMFVCWLSVSRYWNTCQFYVCILHTFYIPSIHPCIYYQNTLYRSYNQHHNNNNEDDVFERHINARCFYEQFCTCIVS